jgi:hypothetical protein
MIVEPGLPRTPPVRLSPIASYGHEQGLWNTLLLAQTPGHFIAIQPWQRDIHKHNLRLKGTGSFECRGAVVSDLHLVSAQAQQQRERLHRVCTAVYDENAEQFSHLLASLEVRPLLGHSPSYRASWTRVGQGSGELSPWSWPELKGTDVPRASARKFRSFFPFVIQTRAPHHSRDERADHHPHGWAR